MLTSNLGPKIYRIYLPRPLHSYHPQKLTTWVFSPYAPGSFRYCINWNRVREKFPATMCGACFLGYCGGRDNASITL